MADVLVLGELNPDVIVRAPGAPRFGQVEQLVEDAVLTLGGSGSITACALRALGMSVAYCSIVGDDAAGRHAVDMLSAHGVDCSAVVVRPGARTGMTVVLDVPGGDRALLTFPGTMGDLQVADVPMAAVRAARHVHISSLYLQVGLQPGLAALLAGRPADVTTSIDPGWDPAERWIAIGPLLGHLDYLLPNAAEARAIVGALGMSPSAHVRDAARWLAAHGPTVVVKNGAAGTLGVAAGGVDAAVEVVLPPRDPVDTTGAGDNFDAGYLSATLSGEPMDIAMAIGAACGAICVSGMGGTGRLASPAEARLLATTATTTSRSTDGLPAATPTSISMT